MDVLLLSRLQFAVATMFHFLFVPLTLGLSVITAIMESIYVKNGDEKYKRMAKFWGKLLIINFAVGVVTGITLEFQFGANWSRYSQYVGDIFGSLLAIEATVAFFLESTFIAVWIFGWKKLSPKAHAACIWVVAIASNISAYWILAANAWMQHPVGYTLRNGRAELTDFLAVVTQKFAILEYLHTVGGAYILSGFFVMGVSAFHILKSRNVDLFSRSFRIATTFALIFSVLVVFTGHITGEEVSHTQPAKLAAMESHWETQTKAPIYLLVIPDVKNERNYIQMFGIPGALSMMAFFNPDAEVTGLKDIPKEERPPVIITFLSFRIMVGLGFLFPMIAFVGWLRRNKLESIPKLLWVFVLAIPLPYIALEVGWALTEVGRQPWIVYGIMKTSDAVSPIATSQVATTLVGFILLYSLLGAAGFYLIYKYTMKGPEPAPADARGEEADNGA